MTNFYMKKKLVESLEKRFPISDINSITIALDPYVYHSNITDDDENEEQIEWNKIKEESLIALNEKILKRTTKKK